MAGGWLKAFFEAASLPGIVAVRVREKSGTNQRRQRGRRIQSFNVAFECQRRRCRNSTPGSLRKQQPRGCWTEVRKRDERSAAIAQDNARKMTTGRREQPGTELSVNRAESIVFEENASSVAARSEDRRSAVGRGVIRDEQLP
jgi:hypothetical protein